jgi:hypothetical protein
VSTGGAAAATGGTVSGGTNAGGTALGGASGGGTSAGGSASGGANAGASSQGGSAAGGSSGATGGGGAAQGGSAGGAAAGAAGCPPTASFCSGFEDATLPTGAVFKLNGDPATLWTASFEIDTTVHNSGKSSLRVKTNSESTTGAYKMLSVPSGGAVFWVRMYIRSDVDLGQINHDVYAQVALVDDPNDGNHIELADDVGLSLHVDDSNIRWPTGYGRLSGGGTAPFTLPKDTWHCIELSINGQARVQKLYVNGTEQISATDFPTSAEAYKVFKFGYNALHGTIRKTWYDDVVVAPARVGCL